MKEVSGLNFGIIIAFWIPGFLLLWILSLSFPDIGTWLNTAGKSHEETVGGFLYVATASLGLGMVLSAVRWLFVDHFLYATFITQNNFNFANLSKDNNQASFDSIVENHYRYYQYYSNSFVAIVIGLIAYLLYSPQYPNYKVWIGVAFIAVCLIWAAKDALDKYNERGAKILGVV
jgi:hypothetical protein